MQSPHEIVLIAHDLRSTHNVGSLLRTAEGLGVSRVYLTGYTPYPIMKKDSRLPHLAVKIDKDITKTALGAEKLVKWTHESDIFKLMAGLKASHYNLVALEQTPDAVPLPDFRPESSVALVVGNEVTGLGKEILESVQKVVEIPMRGKKESFNVVQAAAMAVYHLTHIT